MMYSKQHPIFVVLSLLAITVSVQAAPFAQDNSADKTKYKSLLKEVRAVESDYTMIRSQAVKEVRRDGSASLETKSRLQSLEEKRNRIMDRLLLLSLRYGWDIPDRNMPIGQALDEPTDERDRIFAPADEIIKKVFMKEARQIAGKVRLPLISIAPEKRRSHFTKEGGASS